MFPNMRAEMKRYGKTNADMAKFLGVSDNTFSFKLNGKREFTLEEIKKIAELFSVTIDYLSICNQSEESA
jgi:antitoxin component HigA of HigAB toxin-antitoxin module